MIHAGSSICPDCCGELEYYDKVKRIIKSANSERYYISIRRLQCLKCGGIHREIPDFIFPYKQYDAEIINGVIEGIITSDTIGYEDYPCEMTRLRWLKTFSKKSLKEN